MTFETGDFTEWDATEEKFVRKYCRLKDDKKRCPVCSKELLPDVWYVQINNEVFCTEECKDVKYYWLPPFEIKKATHFLGEICWNPKNRRRKKQDI